MSWQAQTAVRKYGQIRDVNLLYFALYLAEHANEAGHIDPAPNQETMATEFRVSARTVRSWLAKLVSLEVVEQTRIGSGPGRSSAYTFLLPMPEKVEVKAEEMEAPQLPPLGEKMEAKPASISTFTPSESAKVEALQADNFRLRQQMAEMSQKLEALSQKVEAFNGLLSTFLTQKAEAKAEKGGSPTGENEPSINLKDLKDLKELGDPLPPTSSPKPSTTSSRKRGKTQTPKKFRLEQLGDGSKDQTEARLVQELCDFWCDISGAKDVILYEPLTEALTAQNERTCDDYYRPATKLLKRLNYDLDQAKKLLQQARELLVSAGMTPSKISGVLTQAFGLLDKATAGHEWYDPRVPVQGGVY